MSKRSPHDGEATGGSHRLAVLASRTLSAEGEPHVSENAIANLFACFDSVDGLIGEMSDEQWATQSLCPDWDMKGVVAHLAGVEFMLAGASPADLGETIPFQRIFDFAAEAEPMSPSELLARYREVIAGRREELAAMPDSDLETACMTPKGPATYGAFMAIRVFDFWVHEQDMRRPLGLPGHESGPAAEMAIDEIEGALPYIVGKKIGLPDGASITVDFAGPVERTAHLIVDGRARAVEVLPGDPTLGLSADSTTLALLACGRIDPREAIESGAISWTGDPELGERSALNLAYTT